MTLKERDIARFDGGRVSELRPAPVRVRIGLPDLTARDGHRLRCALACSIQPVDRPADRAMLEEVFAAAHQAVRPDTVADHFAPALRAVAADAVAGRDGADWLHAEHRHALLAALQSAAESVAFASGLQVLPPFDLDIESPSLERLRIQEMEQQLHERRRAGQAEQLQRAAAVLRQVKELRDAAPDLPAGRLLEQISPADRSAMFETVLMASGDAAPMPLLVAAGTELLRVMPGPTPSHCLMDLPLTAGPFRSLRCFCVQGRHRLLVGAKSGVIMLDPDEPANETVYHNGGIDSAMGFNAAVPWRCRLCASHSEAGIVMWELDEPNESLRTLPSPASGGPRSLLALDDERLLFAAGPAVMLLRPDDAMEVVHQTDAPLVGLFEAGQSVVAVASSGMVTRLDRSELSVQSTARRCGRISAASTLPWLGDRRLLLATEDGPICCVGLDDSLVTQYTSPYRGLKAIAASPTTLAGISPDRQRLILWSTWQPDTPTELHLASLTRHRLADVCFA